MNTPLDSVLSEVRPITERFAAGGFDLYLVGGIVRDLQLGFSLDQLDFDLTTNARPQQVKRIVKPVAEAVWDQGERFGTIGCLVNGRPFEITTHRAEWYSSAERKPQVEFGDDIATDLSRRDFTVNAMAISVFDGELIDPFGGRQALDRQELATPIDPMVSFGDDPLRILRAARFIARYGLQPVPDMTIAATALVERFDIVSAERIRDELDKLLAADSPSTGIEFLARVRVLDRILPFLPEENVGVLADRLDDSPVDPTVRRAVIFDLAPRPILEEALSSLRYSNEDTREIIAVLDGLASIRATSAVRADAESTDGASAWPDETIRRLIDLTGYERMPALCNLVGVTDPEIAPAFDDAYTKLDSSEDLSSLAPAAGGDDVMVALDLETGPAVGEAMELLRERRIRDGPATLEEELDYLRDQLGTG